MTTARPTTLAFNGMMATPHYLASAAGLSALQDGGSALDAVISANAVLTVVYPDQTSIGGDCFLLYYDAGTGQVHGLNGSGRAPASADRSALKEAGHTAMPLQGIHTVTVPGTIDAWDSAHSRFGRLGMDRLLQPSIGYARDGFPVSHRLSAGIAANRQSLERDPAMRSAYLPNNAVPRPGNRLRLPDLADSLDLIARQGRDAFYTGAIGEQIAATSKRLGGWLTLDDLAAHQAEWVEPLTTDYRGLTVAEMPPNSQGLTTLLALNLVEQETLPPQWGSADHLHPLIEAKKLAFAVRDRELSDPAFLDIDTDRLISKSFARDLWRSFDPTCAGAGSPDRNGDTVYLCAVDRDGNAASIIQSVYLSFGSGIMADRIGIVLQCRGAYFSLDDGHPNRLEPGKRTLHTLMPAMLLRHGRLVGPIGTQGGDAQAQVQLQLITNLVDYEMDPQEAIDAPRWVSGGSGPDAVKIVGLESRFDPSTLSGLAQRGHVPQSTNPWDTNFGHAQMILRDEETGVLRGAADPRADGAALGY